MKCNLCPNLCNIERKHQKGRCATFENMVIARYAPHFFEEPPISGKNGSGTIFFAGCTMDCIYCQNYEISKNPKTNKITSPKQLADIMKNLEEKGVHNINFVTPTHFSNKIREALDIYRPKIPIVYNTSGYENLEILKEMESYIDIYLTDYKYASKELAKKYSGRENYPEICFAATKEMTRQKRLVFDSEGIMKQGVIVRHLVLPGNIKNTVDCIKIFSDNFIDKAFLSVMSQFTPTPLSKDLNRAITPLEYKIAIKTIEKYGIQNCFLQELSSSGKEYIPQWNNY